MRIRALIFDLYNTLLEVGLSPPDAAESWEFLWEDRLADAARLDLAEFAEVSGGIIQREHAKARGLGIAFPEVYWPDIAEEALPELTRLTEAEKADFLWRHAQLQRSIGLQPGAAAFLTWAREHSYLLGLASNSQPYTVREFEIALASAGLGPSWFQSDLCFWSYQAGFSKPDPHVFRFLTARLRARGILAEETVMIGDRLDNDIDPARAHGWQSWQFSPTASDPGGCGGDWGELREFLGSHLDI